MSNKYVYEGGDTMPSDVPAGPLPEGDYKFVVSEFNEPYQKDNGRWVCKIKLVILADDKQLGGQWVWTRVWSGFTNSGQKRDGIGQFLKCVNRAPKKGQTPDWDDIVNARGQCHLLIKTATGGSKQGQEVNEVGYFITPKALDELPENRMTKSKAEYVKELDEKDDDEPDSIPF